MRDAVAAVVLTVLPLDAIAENRGLARMTACAELLRSAAQLEVKEQRDKFMSMSRLYEKSAKGFSGPYGHGLNAALDIQVPETVNDCLPVSQQMR
jgi:hypothetical protein